MHINGLDFSNTVSQGIIFGAVSIIKNHNIDNNEARIKQVNTIYLRRRLKIIRFHADGKFEPLWLKVVMLVIDLNIASN